MKILMINSVCGIRSTGRICTDLADALTEKGHEVKIAYGRESVPEKYQKYAVRIGTDLDVKLHGIKARLFDASGFGSKKATIKFIEWVNEYDPDVIHLHNIHGYYINIEVLFNYLRTCGKKIICTLHDCWAFTGHCTHFDFVGCDKWKTGCHDCPQLKEYPKSIFADRSKKNWEQKKALFTSVDNMVLVTPSHWLAELVKQSYLSKYHVEVIHNGIDTSVFKPTPSYFRERYGLEDKKIVLGVASTWGKRKGFDDFIKLAGMLDDSYKIVMVGLSKKQMKQIPSNILGIMRTNCTKELAEIYTAADVFLNLTYEDNYPTVNLEAQACGTLVITYDTGGSPESTSNGFVTKCGDLESIKNGVNNCITDRMTNEFDYIDYLTVVSLYVNLYEKL